MPQKSNSSRCWRICSPSNTFHDYLNRHEEGTVFELPWEYWGDDEDSFLTKEQCREIIAAAEWEEIEKVKLSN